MAGSDESVFAQRNVRCFTLFRVFFSARFYYPVYALLFLDLGLTLEQFGILNAVWAATIVLAEVPSGALADTIGRRNLLIGTGVLMVIEMVALLLAPINGGTVLFALLILNRVVSGLAEAAASGADEALAYDSLKQAGKEDQWGKVLERVQRDTSLAFFFAMMIGAAVYDPRMVNSVLLFLGADLQVEQSQLVKLPILLTFFSSLVVLVMALRMREPERDKVPSSFGETVSESMRKTVSAGGWIWRTPLPFAIILAAMVLDSVIRQFLTLTSEYWSVIDLPIASYGLIGSGMALLGLFVPRMARWMADTFNVFRNFLYTCIPVLLGLIGLTFAVPYWGILPAILLYAAMQMTSYFVSRYLNDATESAHRATVLSFRGLSTNFSYGVVSILYSILIAGIKLGESSESSDTQEVVFVESLAWFPGYFTATVFVLLVIQWFRFGRKTSARASSE